jgi:hypothetical protein
MALGCRHVHEKCHGLVRDHVHQVLKDRRNDGCRRTASNPGGLGGLCSVEQPRMVDEPSTHRAVQKRVGWFLSLEFDLQLKPKNGDATTKTKLAGGLARGWSRSAPDQKHDEQTT